MKRWPTTAKPTAARSLTCGMKTLKWCGTITTTTKLSSAMTDTDDIVWDSIKKRYRAYLNMHGDRQFLGYFQTPEDGYKARTASAWLHVYDFADYTDDTPQRIERYPRCP